MSSDPRVRQLALRAPRNSNMERARCVGCSLLFLARRIACENSNSRPERLQGAQKAMQQWK